MHALLVGRETSGVTQDALELFELYRGELRRKLGFTFERVNRTTLAAVEAEFLRSHADVVFVMTGFHDPVDEVIAAFRRMYERPRRPKLVYVDYFAQTSSPYFGILPFVDRYAKSKLLRDPEQYFAPSPSGFTFADWYVAHEGIGLNGWYFGSPIDRRYLDRLVLSWNLGVRRAYRRQLFANRVLPKRFTKRRFDLNARLGLQKHGEEDYWYQRYRTQSQQLTESLRPRYRLTEAARVDKRRYMLELRESRVTFSPFGWGEVCYRDYEAIVWGSLLIKPAMEHLITTPNVFVPGQTYVPCAWDLTDFEAKLERALTTPDESQAIIERAQRVLSDYFEAEGWLHDVKRVLAGL